MKVFVSCLVVCAILGLSQAQYQDSPAVAAAKAAHFEAVRRAENVIANAPPSFTNNQYRNPVEETSQHKLGLNVHDTPEVAAAKAAHYAAVQDAAKATAIANATSQYPDSFSNVQQPHQHYVPAVHNPAPTRHPGSYQYQSVPSVHHQHQSAPVPQTTQHKLGVNVQETPEVAAARSAHFEALRRAEQAAAISGPGQYEDSYPRYQKLAPIIPAAPVVRGQVRETPEVIAAKAAHFEAVRLAQLSAGPQHIEPMGRYVQRAHQNMYVPPTTYQQMIPVVAVPQTNQHKLGVNVEDTPEVAAAKKAHLEAFRQAERFSAGGQNEYPAMFAQRNNYYTNPTRQYGQVNY